MKSNVITVGHFDRMQSRYKNHKQTCIMYTHKHAQAQRERKSHTYTHDVNLLASKMNMIVRNNSIGKK